MKGFTHFFLAICVAWLAQGCFESNGRYTGPNIKEPIDHVVHYSIVPHSFHKGVIPIEYFFKGVYGPDRIHVANSGEVSAVLKLDLVTFPSLEDGPYHKHEFEVLQRKSEQFLRNYFSSQSKIIVYTMKREIDHKMRYFVLDVRHPERDESAADYLVSRGLIKVDHEVAKLSGYEHLIKLEKEAQMQDLGVWGLAFKSK